MTYLPMHSANSINGLGQIGGTGFLYSNGILAPLAMLDGSGSTAFAINNAGQAVGESAPHAGSVSDAALFDNGGVTDLWTWGSANAINDNGQIVGEQTIGVSAQNGVKAYSLLYHNGTVTNIGSLPAPYNYGGEAFGINNSGQVVGLSWNLGESVAHAYIYGNGTMTDLGLLPGFNNAQAVAIDNNGEVVGVLSPSMGSAERDRHAFMYSNGTMYDLNSLLDDSGADWTLNVANSVNDHGAIVGEGINPSGKQDAFLLTPVPEPSSIILLTVGGLALFGATLSKRRGRTRRR